MGQDFILDDGCVVIDKHLLYSHGRHLQAKTIYLHKMKNVKLSLLLTVKKK